MRQGLIKSSSVYNDNQILHSKTYVKIDKGQCFEHRKPPLANIARFIRLYFNVSAWMDNETFLGW